jgi:hypothetical protein
MSLLDKEGVDGSSPSEGFEKAPQTGLFLRTKFALRPTCSAVESVMEKRDQEAWPVPSLGERAVDDRAMVGDH